MTDTTDADWDPFEGATGPPPDRRQQILDSLAAHMAITETARQHVRDRTVEATRLSKLSRRKKAHLPTCQECKYWLPLAGGLAGICRHLPCVIFSEDRVSDDGKVITQPSERCVAGEYSPFPPNLRILRDDKTCVPAPGDGKIVSVGTTAEEEQMPHPDDDREKISESLIAAFQWLLFTVASIMLVTGVLTMTVGHTAQGLLAVILAAVILTGLFRSVR